MHVIKYIVDIAMTPVPKYLLKNIVLYQFTKTYTKIEVF